MLAYGWPVDYTDEYIRIGENTVLCCLRQFVKTIVDVFCPQFLRDPNDTDVFRLLLLGEQMGSSGMLESIDYMHCQRKKYLTAWEEMYTGHCHTPTIILQAVASSDL